MLDFTLTTYKELLRALKNQDYSFLPFVDHINNNLQKFIILRHDVDLNPSNSLKTAIYENEIHVKGTYFFRIVPNSNNPGIIKSIVDLGHEIGYHYEDLSMSKGDFAKAISSFERNLEYFRKFYPVKTICMHGSPLSKFDNRRIWDKYNYKDFGIIAEPYFDVDYSKVLYLTDTGRKWNGQKNSVRDKIYNEDDNSNSGIFLQKSYHFRSTFDIINSVQNLPPKIMLTIHPQRWTNNSYYWMKELAYQNIKNIIKRYFFVNS